MKYIKKLGRILYSRTRKANIYKKKNNNFSRKKSRSNSSSNITNRRKQTKTIATLYSMVEDSPFLDPKNDLINPDYKISGGYSDVYVIENSKRDKFAFKLSGASAERYKKKSKNNTPPQLSRKKVQVEMYSKHLLKKHIPQHENIVNLLDWGVADYSLSKAKKIDEKYFSSSIECLQEMNDELALGLDTSHIQSKSCTIYSIEEFCEGGDLFDVLYPDPFINPNWDIQNYLDAFVQIARGIKNIHDNNCAHRDIKPENIMIKDKYNKDNMILKITDFGFLTHKDSLKDDLLSDYVYNKCGTKEYKAPEIPELSKRFESITIEDLQKTDIFALGCMYFLCVNSVHAFERNKNGVILGRTKIIPESIKDNKKQFGMLHKLIEEMITINPSERSNINRVINGLNKIKKFRSNKKSSKSKSQSRSQSNSQSNSQSRSQARSQSRSQATSQSRSQAKRISLLKTTEL